MQGRRRWRPPLEPHNLSWIRSLALLLFLLTGLGGKERVSNDALFTPEIEKAEANRTFAVFLGV
jgi:hypothetical protein